jgi:hypothetical protein
MIMSDGENLPVYQVTFERAAGRIYKKLKKKSKGKQFKRIFQQNRSIIQES